MKKNHRGEARSALPEIVAAVAAMKDTDMRNPAVTHDQVAVRVQRAVDLLHWSTRDLFISTFAYGNVGTEGDLAEHLRTGDHVSPAQAAVIHAALNDALRNIGSTLRV